MNEFRQALDAHAAGKLELGGLERELNLSLTRQPHLAPAHGALIEALYRSGRIVGESYLTLTKAIRSFQQSQPRVSVQIAPAQPAPAAGADDKTQFRAPKAAPAPTTDAAPGADSEKTQFRAPRAAGSGAAPSSGTAPPVAGGLGGFGPPPGTNWLHRRAWRDRFPRADRLPAHELQLERSRPVRRRRHTARARQRRQGPLRPRRRARPRRHGYRFQGTRPAQGRSAGPQSVGCPEAVERRVPPPPGVAQGAAAGRVARRSTWRTRTSSPCTTSTAMAATSSW